VSLRVSEQPGEPELAVVVLSVGAPSGLLDALASLNRQTVQAEIVVVNSGGGDLGAARDGCPQAKFVEVSERLWPGAARNRGIAATRAPVVAFMASDHILTENWCAARLARHRAGHRAVACAVINSNRRSLVAWAHHLAILVRRLPGVPLNEAGLYGVSYERSLFEAHGLFREDLRIGEDTDFNARLSAKDQPVWAPEVRTIHQNATSLAPFLADQYRRGRRSGYHWPLHKKGRSWLLPSLRRFRDIARLSLKCVSGRERLMVVASWPILLVGTLAHGLGFRQGYRSRLAEGFTTEPGPRTGEVVSPD
jgi:GT2 family glycosyltransferase